MDSRDEKLIGMKNYVSYRIDFIEEVHSYPLASSPRYVVYCASLEVLGQKETIPSTLVVPQYFLVLCSILVQKTSCCARRICVIIGRDCKQTIWTMKIFDRCKNLWSTDTHWPIHDIAESDSLSLICYTSLYAHDIDHWELLHHDVEVYLRFS